MASAFQSTAFQSGAFESDASTSLVANAGSIILTGAAASLLSPLTANSGSIVLTGSQITLNALASPLTANASAIILTGGQAILNPSIAPLTANPGAIVLTGGQADLVASLLAKSGAIVLTGAPTEILAPESEVFYLNAIVDLLPAPVAPVSGRRTAALPVAKARRYGERLTVGGTILKVISWSYEETDADISGSLQIELANVADRSLVTNTAVIKFELGEYAGGAWTYQTLVDTGSLERSDYAISPSGVGSPDTFTFTGTTLMNARLNKVPSNTLVVFDPARHEVTAADFEGIYSVDGAYFAPEVVGVSGLTLYKLFKEILETRAGFFKVNTNLPDFPIGIVEFAAGASYLEAIGGIIGMFEPDFSTTTDAVGNLILWIRDGTAGKMPDAPALRKISISQAKSLGVANESGGKTDALLIEVTQERNTFDYYKDSDDGSVVTRTGEKGNFASEYTETTTVRQKREYFRRSKPETPVKTETLKITTTNRNRGIAKISESVETFTYDRMGRESTRTKTEKALVPDPAANFLLTLISVAEEIETTSYKLHPYQPRTYYIAARENVKNGLVVIDAENQQLGEDYSRPVAEAFRDGNMHDGMTGAWTKLSSFKETTVPQRNEKVKIQTFEKDELQNLVVRDEVETREGEVGINIFVEEQKKFYIFSPGKTEIEKGVESINMGELPLDLAVALGTRILAQKTTTPFRVAFGYIGIDNTILKGTLLNVTGRSGENLGDYVVEARTLEADANGYFMTLQARQAS